MQLAIFRRQYLQSPAFIVRIIVHAKLAVHVVVNIILRIRILVTAPVAPAATPMSSVILSFGILVTASTLRTAVSLGISVMTCILCIIPNIRIPAIARTLRFIIGLGIRVRSAAACRLSRQQNIVCFLYFFKALGGVF